MEGRTTEGGCKQPIGSAEGQVSDGEILDAKRKAEGRPAMERWQNEQHDTPFVTNTNAVLYSRERQAAGLQSTTTTSQRCCWCSGKARHEPSSDVRALYPCHPARQHKRQRRNTSIPHDVTQRRRRNNQRDRVACSRSRCAPLPCKR